MKIKQITMKMLEDARKEFKHWYGVDVPLRHMIKFVQTQSYNDMDAFDTVTREDLASYVSELVVGTHWPCYSCSKSTSDKFFTKLKKNCGKFGIKYEE